MDLTNNQKLCLKCMECCKVIGFIVPMSIGAAHFYKVRGWKIKINKNGSYALVYKEEVCPQLTDKGCKIYDTRPLACQLFDGRKDPVKIVNCLWGRD